MSQKKLSTRSLLDLVDLFEQSSQSTVNADGQRIYGVPGWVLSGISSLSDKQLDAWTDCVGYSTFFPRHAGKTEWRLKSKKMTIQIATVIGARKLSGKNTSARQRLLFDRFAPLIS